MTRIATFTAAMAAMAAAASADTGAHGHFGGVFHSTAELGLFLAAVAIIAGAVALFLKKRA